jgi:hypothetical protein
MLWSVLHANGVATLRAHLFLCASLFGIVDIAAPLIPKTNSLDGITFSIRFKLEYVRGIDNSAADALSRHPGFGAVTTWLPSDSTNT